MIPQTLRQQGWNTTHVLLAILLACAGVWLTLDAWHEIFEIAMKDQEASHIFLVPIVAVWMAHTRRIRLLRCPPGGFIIGPILAGVGWLSLYIGSRHGYESLFHLGAVLITVGLALGALGKYVFFRFLPAFLVLVFLVPVPGVIRQSLSIPLQHLGAQASQALLETLGKDVERSGNVLQINGVDVGVAEACNGMRMVFALVLVSYAFAFSRPLQTWARITILIASPAIALGMNVIRLSALALLFGSETMGMYAEDIHRISGWLMLPICFFLLLGVVRALQWALLPVNRYTLAYQ